MLTKNSIQWMSSRKILGENIFLAVLLISMMFIVTIGIEYSINIFSFEAIILSLSLISILIIFEFTIFWAIKRYPGYVQTPRRNFQYAPIRSVGTFLLSSILGIALLTTVVIGILTKTLIESMMIAAIIFSAFLPLKIIFLSLWIKRLIQ